MIHGMAYRWLHGLYSRSIAIADYCIIHVRNEKENRDWLVPMHKLLIESIRIYLESRIHQKEHWLFPLEAGELILCSWLRVAFLKYIRYIGIETNCSG